uniref:mRNA 5'-phosphatase n=1 Tax=Spongospora subterranea TaxID=70186 RepID=A0A0H5QRG8_9EUKA|eukprot:CRZ04635.1 hypothetical protein [Spongospora subterranea]
MTCCLWKTLVSSLCLARQLLRPPIYLLPPLMQRPRRCLPLLRMVPDRHLHQQPYQDIVPSIGSISVDFLYTLIQYYPFIAFYRHISFTLTSRYCLRAFGNVYVVFCGRTDVYFFCLSLCFVLQNNHDLQFEGKVGLICNKNSRLNLGVMGTTPLRSGYFETLPDVSLNFVPGVSEEQFQRLLRILTQWSNAEHVRYGIKYRHSVELDHFHEDRVRTSINEKTQQPLRHVKKSSLGHLDIHVPSSQYDIRFSANTGNLRQFTLVVVIF